AEQGGAISLGGRGQAQTFEAVQYEGIDAIAGPLASLDGGQLWSFRQGKSPVLLPVGPLFDPAAQQVHLVGGQARAMLFRRHALGIIRGADAAKQLALLRPAWHKGLVSTEVGESA